MDFVFPTAFYHVLLKCLFLICCATSIGCNLWEDTQEKSEARVRRNGGFIPRNAEVKLFIHNNSESDIYISKMSWDSFGLCCPPRGIVPKGTGGSFNCKWLELTPSETTVLWRVESTGIECSQHLELKRLAEHSFINEVHFGISKDNKWEVWYDDDGVAKGE